MYSEFHFLTINELIHRADNEENKLAIEISKRFEKQILFFIRTEEKLKSEIKKLEQELIAS